MGIFLRLGDTTPQGNDATFNSQTFFALKRASSHKPHAAYSQDDASTLTERRVAQLCSSHGRRKAAGK